jgi:hypothetical protein
MPADFTETPYGRLLIADGFGPVLSWDGFSDTAGLAGVPAPTTAPTITFAGVGPIVGDYLAFVRYVDDQGFPSNPSPASAQVTASTSSGAVTGATDTSPIQLTLKNHQLLTGATIKVVNVGGQTGANGVWVIDVIDANTVSLRDSFTSDVYTGGGTWTAGALSVVYTNLPTPSDARVVRRQVLRNTDGQATTFYVDIDTNDLSSTTLSSTRADSELSAQVAVPLLDPQGADISNIHGEPPDYRPYIHAHQNRIFAAGEVIYAEGAVAVTYGSTTVQGIGTEWQNVTSRVLYIQDGDRPYPVKSIDPASQTITLLDPYTGPTNPYALYALRAAEADRRGVEYSDSIHSEGFSPLRSFDLPPDGDDATGLISFDSFLYILERDHLYKCTFQNDPQADGGVFLADNRGCVNERCAVLANSGVYMLDFLGVWLFGTRDAGQVSEAIQTFFKPDGPGPKINFAASRYFHAVHDPNTATIRWFVSLGSPYLPRHSLAYHYTLQRWELEEWPVPIGCSALAKLYRNAPLTTWGAGRPQVFMGTSADRVLAFNAGPLDGPDPAGATLLNVVSAGARTLTLDGPPAPDVVGGHVEVIDGPGRGQKRYVAAVADTVVTLTAPWLLTPNQLSVVQFGGVSWRWKSGWLRLTEVELNTPRTVQLEFEPVQIPQRVVLQHYRDRSDTPLPAYADRSADGLTVRAGDGDAVLDVSALGGGVAVSMAAGSKQQYARGPRLVSVGLSGPGGVEPVRVYQINVDGVLSPGPQTPDNNPAT